jgi:hypothetical protein
MRTPRLNWFLLIVFVALTIGLFVAPLVSPALRSNRLLAYAPLRELILPPPSPIVVTVLYSTEKEAWLTEVIASFEASRPLVDGHPIQIEMEKMGSREIYQAVLDGKRQPDLISPASSLQIAILQDLSGRAGAPVVNLADTDNCRPVVKTPLVIVAWKERAAVLWGDNPNSHLWTKLHDILINPEGWASVGQPDWGYVKFGHTDPLRSNSGFMTILLMTYNYYGRTSGLSAGDVTSNPDFQKWFLEFEKSISQFEYSTGPLMEKMVAYGPSVYDIVAVYEATAIEQAENAVGRYGDLRVYYPPATVWSDHPFCILNADWVTADKAKAAQVFVDYLTRKPAQEVALLKYGFRPVDESIPLDQPGSPLSRYAPNGFQSDLSGLPVVEVPPGNVLDTLLEFWSRNIQR